MKRWAIPLVLLVLTAACGTGASGYPGSSNSANAAGNTKGEPPSNTSRQPEDEPLPTDDIKRKEVPDEYANLQPPKPLDDPEFIERGRKLYLGEAACAMCHGDGGAADGQMALQYHDPPVTDLTSPLLHNSISDQYIYWRLVEIQKSKYYKGSGMAGYPAVAFDGEITEAEAEKVWAVVAFVRSLRKD